MNTCCYHSSILKDTKRATFFSIIKGSPGHKTVQSKWESHTTKALAWVTQWHLKQICMTDVRAACLSAQFCCVALTRVDRSADQQVISINPGRYQNKANSNVEIIPPAQPHLLQIRTKKEIITALSLSQLDAVSLRGLCCFVLKD